MNTSIKRLLLIASMVGLCAQTTIVSATKQVPSRQEILKKVIRASGYLVGGALIMSLPYTIFMAMKRNHDRDLFIIQNRIIVSKTLVVAPFTGNYSNYIMKVFTFSDENKAKLEQLRCDIDFYKGATIPAFFASIFGVIMVDTIEKSNQNYDSDGDDDQE